MKLAFKLFFSDLYERDGILLIHHYFEKFLQETDFNLCELYGDMLKDPDTVIDFQMSDLCITLAPIVEDFIAHLFNITQPLCEQRNDNQQRTIISHIRRNFVQRQALKDFSSLESCLGSENEIPPCPFKAHQMDDYAIATQIADWQKHPIRFAKELDQAKRYIAFEIYTREQSHIPLSPDHLSCLFSRPQKRDYAHLLHPYVREDSSHCFTATALTKRSGFNLTDQGLSQDGALLEAHYCIHCHHQTRDSCRQGFFSSLKNPLDVPLTGCPLRQKISEMNLLFSQGYTIGALAVAMIDNPMLAATGHRICNDCETACIFQKQTAVDVPGIETALLNRVLDLPFGFEIYSLLSRWNPLNLKRPFPDNSTHKKVLVVGAGPAGFTLSHHLLNDGHTVVTIDGLKIEPLPHHLLTHPIENWKDLTKDLSERTPDGFGGVLEYGITPRFNKNYLLLIRLLLERRQHFLLKGSTYFGGILTIETAFDLGFHHIALCIGAGSPSMLDLKGSRLKGLHLASDFLMALQLSGAHRSHTLMNLQIEMPIVVVGGGLTAIDTATEAMAYYPKQVTLFEERYNHLVQKMGKHALDSHFSDHEQRIIQTFLNDAKEIRGCDPNDPTAVQRYMQSIGGVQILYRSNLQKAPSYRLNAKEITYALQEGVTFLTHATPQQITSDDGINCTGIDVLDDEGKMHTIPAKTILIAIGTKPNTNIRDDIPSLPIHSSTQSFATIHDTIMIDHPLYPNRLSLFGDAHPTFHGSVVNAMASAKNGYPLISNALARMSSSSFDEAEFINTLTNDLSATVESITPLNGSCFEITIKAPLAAHYTKPGHIFKLQNYEALSPKVQDIFLASEGVALNPIQIHPDTGCITFLIYEAGASTMMLRHLKAGDPVALLGPNGSAIPIQTNKTILLIATHLHSAVLWDLAKAMKSQGCTIIFIVSFYDAIARYNPRLTESVANTVLWCYTKKPSPKDLEKATHDADPFYHRLQDILFEGSIIDAVLHYKDTLNLVLVDDIIIHGANNLNVMIKNALMNEWKDVFPQKPSCKGSINAPMQCMMKGICSQCIHFYEDSIGSGIWRMGYSCKENHQSIQNVDFDYLNCRMERNSVLEKISRLLIKNFIAET